MYLFCDYGERRAGLRAVVARRCHTDSLSALVRQRHGNSGTISKLLHNGNNRGATTESDGATTESEHGHGHGHGRTLVRGGHLLGSPNNFGSLSPALSQKMVFHEILIYLREAFSWAVHLHPAYLRAGPLSPFCLPCAASFPSGFILGFSSES